jgi:hypothetical protein
MSEEALKPDLKALSRLLGTWTTEATHPAMPGVVVHGTVVVEWLEGEHFLIHRSRTDHPDFPNAISIIGASDQDRVDEHTRAIAADSKQRLTMHYFDQRGVFRLYDASVDDKAWRFWRDSKGFSQRFVGTFADGGKTIRGVSQLCRDDEHWQDDLQITYRRT